MKELEILLDRRWILKSEDKELYYKVRDSIGEIRRFATEKMGCQIIENSLLVKMEKIPAIPQAFMGIEDFTSREEYVFLCMLLMFLEDKDGEEQFILSQLTEYIEANMPGTPVDWTIYTNRRRMVKVLRYAASQGLIKVTDGSDDLFMDEKSGEVLYENTGASRYFMRNFSRDMYKNAGPEEDFEYLKYYGRRLAEDLEQNFDCQVHIHKGSAFFMMGDDCRMGSAFPGNNALSDIILLCCGTIREKVTGGLWKTGSDDRIIVEKIEFENMLKEVKSEKGSGFTKNYREMPEGEFVRELTESLERWTFIQCDENQHQVEIYPSAGKMAGCYPEDYTGGNKNEQ